MAPATSCIDDFIAVISSLLEKGYAYQAGGNIYFGTSKLKTYYVFNNFNKEDLAVGVREGVEEDTNKRNSNDFVLWFTKSKFEDQALKWDSPWGVGYPGWHIECSCISMKYLGQHLDIHCGGIDNAFPHHTNEIAQSEAYLGHKWCTYWFHVLHLNTNSGKMSKSSGEFLTVSLLEEKGYDPMVYRFFCLGSHYRKALVFSWENLDNAATAYGKLLAKIRALGTGEPTEADREGMDACRAKFAEALDNDLNTSLGITALYETLKAPISDGAKRALLAEFDQVLSLSLLENAAKYAETGVPDADTSAQAAGSDDRVKDPEKDPVIRSIEERIAARAAAKKAKNYAEADRIRAELAAEGVTLTDTPTGTTYTRS